MEIINGDCNIEVLIEIAKRYPSIEVQKLLFLKNDPDIDIAMINSSCLSEEVANALSKRPNFEVRTELALRRVHFDRVMKTIDNFNS